jgi:hypothetical protein
MKPEQKPRVIVQDAASWKRKKQIEEIEERLSRLEKTLYAQRIWAERHGIHLTVI